MYEKYGIFEAAKLMAKQMTGTNIRLIITPDVFVISIPMLGRRKITGTCIR